MKSTDVSKTTEQQLRELNDALLISSVHQHELTEKAENAETALRESEYRRRLALDSAELGTWHVDPATKAIKCDQRFRDIFGATADWHDYEPVFTVMHPEDQSRVREAVAAATRPENPEPYSIEYRIVRPDGSIRWVFAKGRVNFEHKASGPTAVSFDGTVADITDRKWADDALREARDAAELANRSKDRFLAVLSHELRTPLTPVVMTIAAIEIDPDLPFKFREDLAMVRRNIDLEVKLIDDLLDLSRITSGKLRLHLQPVRVHEVLDHVLRSSVSETSSKRLRVRQDLQASNDQLKADPARLQQVFWNLLRNAVKFTPEGGDVTIRTWNADADEHLYIEVRDTGIGIEPDVLPRIFDAFEQGEARVTRQFGGLGLGLAIAKAVVEIHGGTISASSEGRGRGAAFTVALGTIAAPSSQRGRISALDAVAEHLPGRQRVLLVEDHPDTARVLARLLTGSGYEVTTANSAASALQHAAAGIFDIVISDIGLPDATGYELMEQIRDRHGIKGIALSGYGMEDDVRKGREAGFLDHVVKPVNFAQLQLVISRVINSGVNDAQKSSG